MLKTPICVFALDTLVFQLDKLVVFRNCHNGSNIQLQGFLACLELAALQRMIYKKFFPEFSMPAVFTDFMELMIGY